MLPLVIATLLGLSALAVVVVPLFAPGRAVAEPDGAPASTLADRERAARAALHDVEFDYQLGNLADDDYQSLRERYTRRALAALKGRYDRERAADEAIEAQVRALRAAESGPSSAGRARGGAGATASHASNGAAPSPKGTTSPRRPRQGPSGRSRPDSASNGHGRRRGRT